MLVKCALSILRGEKLQNSDRASAAAHIKTRAMNMDNNSVIAQLILREMKAGQETRSYLMNSKTQE